MPKTPITWKLDPQLIKVLQEIAKEDKRQLTNVVEAALKEYITNKQFARSVKKEGKKIKR